MATGSLQNFVIRQASNGKLILMVLVVGELTHEEMIMELASRAKADRSATPPRSDRPTGGKALASETLGREKHTRSAGA
jgi:hypothetical protein